MSVTKANKYDISWIHIPKGILFERCRGGEGVIHFFSASLWIFRKMNEWPLTYFSQKRFIHHIIQTREVVRRYLGRNKSCSCPRFTLTFSSSFPGGKVALFDSATIFIAFTASSYRPAMRQYLGLSGIG